MIGYDGRLCVTRACKYLSSRRVPLRWIDALSIRFLSDVVDFARAYSERRYINNNPSGGEIIYAVRKRK